MPWSYLQDFVGALGCEHVATKPKQYLTILYRKWMSEKENIEWASLEYADLISFKFGEPVLACDVLEEFAFKEGRSGRSGLC